MIQRLVLSKHCIFQNINCSRIAFIRYTYSYGISVSHMTTYMFHYVSTSRSFRCSWLITGFVTWLTRRVALVEQKLLTLPEHLRSSPIFSGVHVTRSLILYVCFVDRCLSFCTFWPLCCLFFCDMRILITPLVSSYSHMIKSKIIRKSLWAGKPK